MPLRRTSVSSLRGGDSWSAVSDETDDTTPSGIKRRRTATAGFQPLAQVRETAAAEQDVVRPWMVEVREHDVVLGKFGGEREMKKKKNEKEKSTTTTKTI